MALKTIQQVKNCKKLQDDKGNISYRLEDVRLSYPHLFRLDKYERYSATFILDKKTHTEAIKFLIAELKALATAELKQQVPPHLSCLVDGSGSGKPELEGCWSLSAHDSKRPLVVGADRTPVAEEDGTVYAGCYVNANVSFWAFSGNSKKGSFPKRLVSNLIGIQYFRPGEAFSAAPARPDAADVFEEFETEEAGSTSDAGDPFDDLN